MRTIKICLAIFMLCVSARGQNGECELMLSQVPELRGLRLGMTAEATVRYILGLKIQMLALDERKNEFGWKAASFIPHVRGKEKHPFSGVSKVEIEVLDGILTSVKLEYDSTVRWKDVDEFVAAVSPPLRLPSKWPVDDSVPDVDAYKRKLDCLGFAVEAEVLGGASLRIFNTSTAEIIEKRKAAKEAKEKSEFKP
jgi:hypothetical protein